MQPGTPAEATIVARAHIPDVITKDLAISRVGDSRRIRLSSNFLPLMGFETGSRHSVDVLGKNEGLRLAFDPSGPQKVYSRMYKSRKNNPFEAVVEINSQSILDSAVPSYIERVHIMLRSGEIVIRPLANKAFSIRRQLRDAANPYAAFVAMTAGVDVRCLQDTGFTIDSVLEYRPREARDTTDLTETGALNVLANARPRLLINEDISTVDWLRVQGLMKDGPQISVVHLSLQCDDFSNVKAASLKAKSLEDLTTTRDLVYDGLRLVETIMPAVVMLENVGGFSNSAEGQLFKTKLRKWGYHITEGVLSAPEYGGITGRSRYYLIGSMFPGFEMPTKVEARTAPIWGMIEPYLANCRDVSHTKSLQDGLSGGRARLITPVSMNAPTLLKSQSRQAKDSIFIAMPDGRYLFPSLELQRFLNGIPADFNLDCVAEGIGSEIIGQSIEYPMHHALCRAVHQHIGLNVGKHSVINIAKESPAPRILAPVSMPFVSAAAQQMNLFN